MRSQRARPPLPFVTVLDWDADISLTLALMYLILFFLPHVLPHPRRRLCVAHLSGSGGGTSQTISEITSAMGQETSAQGWYAQAQSGTLFDG